MCPIAFQAEIGVDGQAQIEDHAQSFRAGLASAHTGDGAIGCRQAKAQPELGAVDIQHQTFRAVQVEIFVASQTVDIDTDPGARLAFGQFDLG